jgi:hypothetical protein
VHGRPLAPRAISILLAGSLLACAGGSRDEWEPAAARAVARHVQAAEPAARLVVLAHSGGAQRDELPWGVRQSLTTAGIVVGDSSMIDEPGVLLLALDGSERDDGAWRIRTRLLRAGTPAVNADTTAFLVRCDLNDECSVQPR